MAVGKDWLLCCMSVLHQAERCDAQWIKVDGEETFVICCLCEQYVVSCGLCVLQYVRTYAVVSSVYCLWSVPFLVAVCGRVVFRSASATGDQSL